MSEEKTIRLSKITRELNIGVNTIVDFLSDKGLSVESNANAKITQEAYVLLCKEFQSEKSAKEEAQLLNVIKQKKEVLPEPPVAEPLRVAAVKEEPKAAPVAEVVSPPAPKVVQEEIKEPTEDGPTVIKGVGNHLQGPTIVGKIDIDSINSKSKPDKKSAKTKAKDSEKTTAPAEPQADKAQEAPGAETPQEADHAKSPEATASEPAASSPATENPIVAEGLPSDAVKDEEAKDDNIYRTNVTKLTGPTVLGRIELPTEQAKRKPVASSTMLEQDRNRKKKRKRTDKKGTATGQPAQNLGEKSPEGTTGDARGANRPILNRPTDNRPRPGGKPPENAAQRQELDDKKIQEQIKNTLARLSGVGKSKGAKHRKLKRETAIQEAEEAKAESELQKKVVKVTEFVSANELSKMMNVSITDIISTCMSLGIFVSINQRLDAETLSVVAEEFGYTAEFVSAEVQESIKEEVDTDENTESRAPIVTVMGHVDHGKTSLLDYIRKANVISGEAGGITQHIGAYEVRLESGKKITFLDTPGHEAFTAMRARGAKVTDVAIILVSADDSVMPQTIEAINHAQAAGVPLVFAINKIDKAGANPEKIKEQLAKMNILVEDWGGKFQSQEISAKSGLNIEKLLDKVLLEAELLDLKANANKNAVGTVIESSLDKGRGYVTTLLVQAGTLKIGDVLLAGRHSGRVKAMFNERGGKITEAGPSTPVLILGMNGAPQAGDKFNVLEDEREARDIANKRMQLQREQGIRTHKHITLAEIGRRLAIGNFKELNVIIKGDVDGSIEALSDSLQKLSTNEIQINIIHKSVGAISESDVLLASASNAIIIGFQVRPSATARKLAEQEEIDIRLYSIIYDAINELKSAMVGMLAPEYEEKITCNIEIRETFKIPKIGTIAGCMVLDGKINRNTKIRLVREGIVVYSGELASLKRFKDDVKEVSFGYECGLNIANYNDIQVGDIVEGYEQVAVKRTAL
jgi:translation initiation factor IF-2